MLPQLVVQLYVEISIEGQLILSGKQVKENIPKRVIPVNRSGIKCYRLKTKENQR